MFVMQTDVMTIDALRPEPSLIERAAALLRAGDVVVFPTETVYGLGADALQPSAVARIFEAKGRPFHDPLIVHIAERETLNELTTTLPAQVEQLAQAFWPGPLTMILPRSPRVPELVSAGMPTVGVRMPAHPVALALIRAVGSPIAAPSANRFMHVSPTTAQHALADLQGRVPLILDAGPCTIGVESTVVDLCAEVPTILRPGGISLEALRSVLPDVQLLPRRIDQPKNSPIEEAQRAPGQMLTHYAPVIPLFLFDGSPVSMRSAMLREVQRRREQGETVGVLIANEDSEVFQESGAQVFTLGDAAAPEQVAATLFTGLRTLEEAGVDVILCRNFDSFGLGLAIRDRLLRAASGKVIYES